MHIDTTSDGQMSDQVGAASHRGRGSSKYWLTESTRTSVEKPDHCYSLQWCFCQHRMSIWRSMAMWINLPMSSVIYDLISIQKWELMHEQVRNCLYWVCQFGICSDACALLLTGLTDWFSTMFPQVIIVCSWVEPLSSGCGLEAELNVMTAVCTTVSSGNQPLVSSLAALPHDTWWKLTAQHVKCLFSSCKLFLVNMVK